jgi:hypothetical protein
MSCHFRRPASIWARPELAMLDSNLVDGIAGRCFETCPSRARSSLGRNHSSVTIYPAFLCAGSLR